MSDEKKKKYAQHTTSKGTFKFCHLNKPNDKFKAEGEYSVDFLQTPEEAKALTALIDAEMGLAAVQAKKDNPKVKNIKVADKPYKMDTDQDGNETGLIKFKFKAKASGMKKDKKPWTFRPAVFDAKGGVIPNTVQIWGGTIGRVSFELMPFYTAQVGAGVSLRLKAVKILDLKTGQGRDAKAYGFGDEEDGYSAEGAQVEQAGGGEADGSQDF